MVSLVGPLATVPSWANPLVFTPYASLSEEYNDNIYFTKDRVEDYVTSVNVGLSLDYRAPRLTATLTGGSTTGQFYAHNSSQNDFGVAQGGTLAATYLASPRLTVSASDSVSRVGQTRTGSVVPSTVPAPEGGTQPGPSSQASTLLPRGEAIANSFTMNASYLLAPRWSGGLAYRNSIESFSNPGGTDQTNAATLSLGYTWSPTTSTSLFYGYSRFNVHDATDTESHNVGIGASYRLLPVWTLSASAGVFVNRPLQSNGDSQSTSTGPTFDLALTRRFEHSSLLLEGSQAVTTSAGVAGISTTRSAFGSYEVQLLEHLHGSLGIDFSDFDTSGTTFSVLSTTAGLSFPLGRYLSAGVSYSYRWRHSNQTTQFIDAGTVDGNLVQVFVSASYPVWRGNL